jgi:hypothetical protein
MTEYTFRVVGILESNMWSEFPPLGKCAIYGTYLVREGEATFCASIMPSSRGEFIENAFIFDNPENYNAPENEDFIGENLYADGDSGCQYFNFIDFGSTKIPHSKAIKVEVDDDEGEDEAWEKALEYVRGNHQYVDMKYFA